ncbi:Acetolactate synthase 2, partial [Nymphaea thermarum]
GLTQKVSEDVETTSIWVWWLSGEDRFYKANRAHTYLGDPVKESEIFSNMLKFAEVCNIPAARIFAPAKDGTGGSHSEDVGHSRALTAGCDCPQSGPRPVDDSHWRGIQGCDHGWRWQEKLLKLWLHHQVNC